MTKWEGLNIPDCGDVAGETCEDRQRNRCIKSLKLRLCRRRCSECLYDYPSPNILPDNLDAYRRWEAAGCPMEEEASQ